MNEAPVRVQFIANGLIGRVHVNACRFACMNEALTVYLLEASDRKTVCPHASNMGLWELCATPIPDRLRDDCR